jgi:hypothetical protein
LCYINQLKLELTSGDEIILSRDENSSGISFGTDASSRSPDRRARHLKAPRTETVRKRRVGAVRPTA